MKIAGIKNILVALTEDGSEETPSALDYALSFAAEAEAHLTVMAASMRVEVAQAAVSRTISDLVTVEQKRREAKAADITDYALQISKAAGVPCSVERPFLNYTDLRQSFKAKARVHDLVVLDAEASAIDLDRGLIHAAIYSTGRPVIVVPEGRDSFRLGKCVLAWDGSAAATRAINDALPLLRSAQSVELLSVGDERELAGPLSGADIARQLRRHGIEVVVNDVTQSGLSLVGTIRAEVARARADLLVMGAYGHSRLREFVLGGVSRSLLQRCEVPLFLSH
ncbi:MAG: universal stress protein [Hyphomicrobiaceae bacterium]|nr:universal stress protein [Hyphomicrobiaceae bacterium]